MPLPPSISFPFACLLAAGILCAASSTPDPWLGSRPALGLYGQKEGLPSETVYQLLEDRTGQIWAATQDGTALFDGLAWRNLDLPPNAGSSLIRALLHAQDGSRWIGTEHGGLLRLQGQHWTHFRNELPVLRVNALAESPSIGGSSLWVGTGGGGIARYHQGCWSVQTEAQGLRSNWIWRFIDLKEPNGSRQLLAATLKGFLRLHGERWEPWEPAPGTADLEVGDLAWHREEEGWRLWMTTWGKGLWSWDGKQLSRHDPASGFPSHYPITLRSVRDRAGRDLLWVGSYDQGLFLRHQGRWRSFSKAQGLPGTGVYSLLTPAAGKPSLWMGLRDGGAASLDLGGWRTLDSRTGLPGDEILSLAETGDPSGGSFHWIGTDQGLARSEKEQWRVFSIRDGLPGNRINALLPALDGVGLWAGTQKGLAYWNGHNWKSVPFDSRIIQDEQIICLVETHEIGEKPVLWIGTESGLIRKQGTEWRLFTQKDGLPSNYIYSLLPVMDPDMGTSLWIGTRGGGLGRLKQGRWSCFGLKEGLPHPDIYHLRETRRGGHRWLWAASFGGGLLRRSLDREGTPWEVWDDQKLPGLPSKVILRIEEDAQSRLYLATRRGVARLSFPDAGQLGRPTVESFSLESGLPSVSCNFGASYRDSQGRIWIGTHRGAALLDPEWESPLPAPVSLQLLQLRIGGRPASLEESRNFSHRQNSLILDFTLPFTAKPGDVWFQTQLQGLESTASPWSRVGTREFSGLPAGDYTLRIWGKDGLGRQVPPLDFSFRIRPAPWNHPAARALYGLLTLLLIWAAVQGRHRALQRRNEELEEKVHQRTRELEASEARAREASQAKSVFLANMSHELRTPLNAILGFANLMRRDSGLRSKDADYLERIHRAGEHLLGLINDVLSISKIEAGKLVLNPGPFSLRPMLETIEDIIQVRAQEKGLRLVLEVAQELPACQEGDENKLRQVLINLLGNAVKFTSKGEIGLKVTRSGEQTRFEVWDTGSGIAPEEMALLFQAFQQTSSGRHSREGTGLGLHISAAMVRLMGGELQVESQLGKGTRFFFQLPLEASEALPLLQPQARQIQGLEEGQGSPRILVADDVLDNRDLARQLLESWGFEVRAAEDGLEALELWETWKPVATFLDLRMPRLDGESALRRMRQRESDLGLPSSVVFALSASVLDIDRNRLLEAGFNEFLQKPLQENHIAEALENFLQLRFRCQSTLEPRPSKALDRKDFPADWLEEFRKTLILGDEEMALHQLAALGEHPAAQELELQVRAFRFDELLQQLEDPHEPKPA